MKGMTLHLFHKWPKRWSDGKGVWAKSHIVSDQFKRCSTCGKIKIKETR